MNYQTLSILLPFLALGFAAISGIAFWMWWQSVREESDELPDTEDGITTSDSNTPVYEEASMTSSFVERINTLAQGVVSKAGDLSGRARTLLETRTTPQPVPSFTPHVATVDPGAVEVMRVLRDLADGTALVEIDGKRFRSMDEIDNPGIKRRFIGNVLALAEFAHLAEFDPEAFEQLAEVSQLLPEPVTPPVSPVEAPLPLTESKWHLAAEREPEDEALRTIAGQIESLLQQRLTGHPEWAQRSIHIRDSFDGGIRIEVDDQSYDSVGDVVDEEVREFLQSIINEWEARQ